MNESHAQGVLLGLAVGDALGRPVEFKTRQQIQQRHGTLTEMIGNGTWSQPSGTITDDTEQALAIARSLATQGRFDPADIARRFVDWYDSDPFDVGVMTQKSLHRLRQGEAWEEAGRRVWRESSEGKNAGNGSVMRSPPLAIAYGSAPTKLTTVSMETSVITHADYRCQYGSAILNLTIAAILQGKSAPLQSAINHVESSAPEELLNALEPIASGEPVQSLPTSGYVVHTLQTAFHDGLRSDSVEEAIVTAVNRGGDTDTIGAITGAIAGARFGNEDIPDNWLDAVEETDELNRLAKELMEV